jgi:AcrR family transcriptional regulator
MDLLLSRLSIQVCDSVFIKDPESSDLGKKIIVGSIDMLDTMGFDHFTFRKLAKEIGSTEASIYRYFESKHKLLLYLTSWYWSWMEYRLMFGIANVPSAIKKLKIAIRIVTEEVVEDNSFTHINEVKLNRIVVAEASKSYMTKEVDAENKEGVFVDYKRLVARISDIVLECDATYKYPQMLISTVIEGAHSQHFFAEHLPKLTNVYKGENSVTRFYTELTLSAIGFNEK